MTVLSKQGGKPRKRIRAKIKGDMTREGLFSNYRGLHCLANCEDVYSEDGKPVLFPTVVEANLFSTPKRGKKFYPIGFAQFLKDTKSSIYLFDSVIIVEEEKKKLIIFSS